MNAIEMWARAGFLCSLIAIFFAGITCMFVEKTPLEKWWGYLLIPICWTFLSSLSVLAIFWIKDFSIAMWHHPGHLTVVVLGAAFWGHCFYPNNILSEWCRCTLKKIRSHYSQKIVTILVSDGEEWFLELIAQLTHNTSEKPVKVVSLTPGTSEETELLKTAARYNWQMAILFLNNISYSSTDRNSTMPNNSIELVRKITATFNRPIIAVHGLSEGPWYQEQLLDAGATGVFRIPFETEKMEKAIKQCLGTKISNLPKSHSGGSGKGDRRE